MINLSAQITIFNRISLLDKLLFTKHLSIMIKSGIPLAESIETIRNQTYKTIFKNVLTKVLEKVENGQSLEKALSQFPKFFDPLFLGLIRTGEESGNLEKNLEYLSSQLRKEYEFRKKIQGAMLYPMIVFIATILVGFGVSYFLLPQLAVLLKSLDVKLPLSTQILLFVADTFRNYGFIIFPALLGLFILFRIVIELPNVKPLWHKLLLKLPITGLFIKNAQLSSVCRNLGVMLKSGLPIVNALEIQYQSTTNLVFKEYIGKIKIAVEKGKTIEQELDSPQYQYVPAIVGKMVGVGEKSGKLEDSFLYLGDFFEEEVDNQAKNLSTVLEPILLLVIGIVVAFVALAVISPIYELTGSIKK